MAEMLFMLHSGTRYLVLLAGVVAVVAAIVAVARGRLTRAALTSGRIFVVLLDIQVTIGIVLVFVWPFYSALIGHIVMMVLAIGAAHALAGRVRKQPPEARSPGTQLAAVLVPLILIIGGILAIGRPIIGSGR